MDTYNWRFDAGNSVEKAINKSSERGVALYTVGEAADVLGVSVQTLRYYEAEGLVIPIHRQSRHRRYTHEDIDRLRCVRNMINKEKVSIQGIKRLLAFIPCWEIRGCSEASRRSCPAVTNATLPCWMVSNKSKECRNVECRLCAVYTQTADCHRLKQVALDCGGLRAARTNS